jgi:hypothetical protein
MANQKISALTAATTPLAGTEVLPIVQSGATVKVAVSDLTAGRAISATAVTASTGDITSTAGNFVVGTSGKGIDFSATPGTGTSELLADYEEGTWTPTITGSTSQVGQVYSTQDGTYTKIGRQVTLRFNVTLVTEGTFVGLIQISGFPFNSAASPAAVNGGQLYFVDMATNYITIGTQILESSATAFLWSITAAATSRGYVGNTDLTDTTRFTGTIVYFV